MICHHPIEGAELGACLANLSSKVPLRISKNERFCSPPFLEQLFSRPESRVIGLDWTVWTDEELSMIFAHAPKHLTRSPFFNQKPARTVLTVRKKSQGF